MKKTDMGRIKLYGLDLFSGIGGIGIGLSEWVTTIAYCEQDPYCQGVLLSRMSDGAIDRAPIWDDVQTLTAEQFETIPDIIFGGFPCQDISVAGKQAGLAGKRSGLFFEIIRLTKELKPAFLFLENVPGIRTNGLDVVIKELTEIGYDSRWTMLAASEIGAPHIRERWFLLAHANGEPIRDNQQRSTRGWDGLQNCWENVSGNDGPQKHVADTEGIGLEGLRRRGEQVSRVQSEEKIFGRNGEGRKWWEVEPSVGRVADGIQYRTHRIKTLGNSVVPQQVKEAFQRLMFCEFKRVA